MIPDDSVSPPPSGTLLFDDDCGFCWRAIEWMQARGVFYRTHVTPWQWVPTERLPVDPDRLGHEVVLVRDAEVFGGAQALAVCMTTGSSRWPWLGRFLLLPVVRQVAAAGYRLVARNRHRMPGGTTTCRVPPDTTPPDG